MKKYGMVLDIVGLWSVDFSKKSVHAKNEGQLIRKDTRLLGLQ